MSNDIRHLNNILFTEVYYHEAFPENVPDSALGVSDISNPQLFEGCI